MIELHSLTTHACHGKMQFKILEFIGEDQRIAKACRYPQNDLTVISDVKHFNLVGDE